LLLTFNPIRHKKNKLLESGKIHLQSPGITLIRGKNGTGKTSLLRHLFDTNKGNIAYSSQENECIFKEITIIENISMGFDQERNAEITQTLENWCLSHLKNLNPKTLSGGETRIIAFLRACFSQNPIVFLDEPTNDLDYRKVETMLQIIKNLKATKTFLIVTHDERLVELSDRIYEVKEKKLTLKAQTSTNRHADPEPQSTKKQRLDMKLLNFAFRPNFIQYLLFTMACMFAISTIHLKAENPMNYIEQTKPDQLEVFLPISMVGEFAMTQGAVPAYLMYILSNTTLLNLNKSLETLESHVWDGPLHFGMNLQNSIQYRVYALEFYDVHRHQTLFANELLDPGSDPMSINQEALQHSNETYQALEREMRAMGYEVTFYRLVFHGEVDLDGFIEKHNFSEMNYLLRSNSTIDLVNQLFDLDTLQSTIITSALAYALFIGGYLLSIQLHLSSQKRAVINAYHYGYPTRSLVRMARFKFNSLILQFIGIPVVFLSGYLYALATGIPLLFSTFYETFHLLGALSTGHFFSGILLKHKLRKILKEQR